MNRQTWVIRWLAGNGALLESSRASVTRSAGEGEAGTTPPRHPVRRSMRKAERWFARCRAWAQLVFRLRERAVREVRLQRPRPLQEVPHRRLEALDRRAGRRRRVERRCAGDRLAEVVRHSSTPDEDVDRRHADRVLEERRLRLRKAAHRVLDALRAIGQRLRPAPGGRRGQRPGASQPLELTACVGERGETERAVAGGAAAARDEPRADRGGADADRDEDELAPTPGPRLLHEGGFAQLPLALRREVVDEILAVALPAARFVDGLRVVFWMSVFSVTRTAPSERACSVAARSSAEPTPALLWPGTTNRSLRMKVRASETDEKLG